MIQAYISPSMSNYMDSNSYEILRQGVSSH